MMNEINRRSFLSQIGGGLGAALVSAHWPAMVAAATHAHQAVQSGGTYKFEFFSPDEAADVDAISARIIPSGDATDKSGGAREAGVVYFIDRALMTFAVDDQQKYRTGLPELNAMVREKVTGVQKFSATTPEQQDEILETLSPQKTPNTGQLGQIEIASGKASAGDHAAARTLFEALRVHTIAGFLVEPESAGNRDGVGWKLIGRDPEHVFQPPFGYYDQGYPGWQESMKDAEKK